MTIEDGELLFSCLCADERGARYVTESFRQAAIVGRVLDENGEPIANANVMAWRRPPVANGAPVPARLGLIPAASAAQTNDLGEFRLFGLAPGEVYVQATSHSDFGRSASSPAINVCRPRPSGSA